MKFAIALEGGASRTLFSCGVLDVLLEEEIEADYIIGVSAGIAFGTSYASKQKGRNLELARKYMADRRYMGARHMFRPKNRSYYNLDFVFDEIPNKYVPFDFEEYKKFKGNVVAGVTNMETGKAEYIEIPRGDKTSTALRASCALPLMFKPIKIGGKYYVDGGVADPIPYKKALDDGCDKVIVILTREEDYVKKPEPTQRLVDIAYARYPQLCKTIKERHENYERQREELKRLEKEGKVFVIYPKDTKGFKRTESDPKLLEGIYNQGIEVMRERIEELKEFLNK